MQDWQKPGSLLFFPVPRAFPDLCMFIILFDKKSQCSIKLFPGFAVSCWASMMVKSLIIKDNCDIFA